MIVVTTPTGNVGSQLLAELLNSKTEPLRVIVRNPSRLDDAVHDHVQVIYMENLLRPLPQMTSEGVLSLPLNPDRPLALIATQDIAATAARLLLDRTWEGTDRIPVFSPGHLTPKAMAATISDVLGSQITFEQADLEQVTASTIKRGVPEGTAHDFAAMYQAQQDRIYDEDWSHATPTSTSFRTWCETVLAPAAR